MAYARFAHISTIAKKMMTATEEGTETILTRELTELSRLEIRVGKIVEIGRHPDADGLFVEKIDINEVTGPRTIVSGLVPFCKEEDLLNKNVVILANLKPAKMRGIESFGMVLCSSNEDHTMVSPLEPPAEVPLGELVTFDGHLPEPAEAGNRAVKAWKKVSKMVSVGDDNIARYTDESLPAIFMTSRGPITSPLPGNIS